jgi:hypothetical protein
MPAVICGLESVMQTIVDWFREHEGWRRERCVGCGGHGVVSDYSCGEDFMVRRNAIAVLGPACRGALHVVATCAIPVDRSAERQSRQHRDDT